MAPQRDAGEGVDADVRRVADAQVGELCLLVTGYGIEPAEWSDAIISVPIPTY